MSTLVLTIIITAATVLPLVAVTLVSVNEASAKECNGDSNRYKNKNDISGGTTCTLQQDSNNHHSTKDKTPFALALPFP
jgi:hypothetical protein